TPGSVGTVTPGNVVTVTGTLVTVGKVVAVVRVVTVGTVGGTVVTVTGTVVTATVGMVVLSGRVSTRVAIVVSNGTVGPVRPAPAGAATKHATPTPKERTNAPTRANRRIPPWCGRSDQCPSPDRVIWQWPFSARIRPVAGAGPTIAPCPTRECCWSTTTL